MLYKVSNEILYDYIYISTKFHWVYIFNFCALGSDTLKVMLV